MINSNFHKQYFQKFSSRYIVPQHKNPKKKIELNKKVIDNGLKQS